MATETASTIAQLDAARPNGSETASEGDDHLRLLKSVLKAQFVNLPASLDWATVEARFAVIEARLLAIETSLSTDFVQQDNAGNVVITGELQAASADVVGGLVVGGATDLQALDVVSVDVSANLNVVDTITAEHYRGGDVSVGGDIVAFDGT